MLSGRALVLAVVAALLGTGLVHAAGPRVRVSKPPPGLRSGEVWTAVVAVSGGRPTAFVVARARARATFPLTRRGSRYRARVVFPSPGRWRYGVRVGSRTVLVGAVAVRPRPPVLLQPFGIVEEPSGTLLVADWQAGIVYRIDPRRRDGTIVARVRAPRDLVRTPDGRVLVASERSVLELDAATGRTRHIADAQAPVGAIAGAADGTLYVNEDQSRIVRIAPGREREVLVEGLDGVHGILLTPEGLVICESFAGRVLRLEDGRVRVLVRGLGNPSYAARAANGTLYVGEFLAGRVTAVAPDGATEPIASVPQPGPVALDSAGRILVGTLGGAIYRVDPEARRATRIYP